MLKGKCYERDQKVFSLVLSDGVLLNLGCQSLTNDWHWHRTTVEKPAVVQPCCCLCQHMLVQAVIQWNWEKGQVIKGTKSNKGMNCDIVIVSQINLWWLSIERSCTIWEWIWPIVWATPDLALLPYFFRCNMIKGPFIWVVLEPIKDLAVMHCNSMETFIFWKTASLWKKITFFSHYKEGLFLEVIYRK